MSLLRKDFGRVYLYLDLLAVDILPYHQQFHVFMVQSLKSVKKFLVYQIASELILCRFF